MLGKTSSKVISQKMWTKYIMAQKGQLHFFKSDLSAILDVIDNGPLSNHTKFQLDCSKNGRVMAEKRMPIYGHTRVSEVNFGL